MLKRTQTEPSSFTIAKIDLLAPISKISWDFMPNFKTKQKINKTKVTPLKKMKKKNIKNQNGHNLNV